MKVQGILAKIRKLWAELNKPSAYDIWKEAFSRLQVEREANGKSPRYWQIWHEEVCPAYEQLLVEDIIRKGWVNDCKS